MPTVSQQSVATAIVGVSGAALLLAAVNRLVSLSRGPERRGWASNVFGHRGCRFIPGIVENTLPAYEYAVAKGADGVEIDVRLCRTGELVVFHDEFTDPSCEGPRRRVADMTFQEVQALRYKVNPASRPPTLVEVLDFCSTRRVKLLLEVKHYDYLTCHNTVPEIVAHASGKYRALFDDFVTVISFNPYLLYLLRRAQPRIAVGPLYDDRTITAVAQGVSDSNKAWWLWFFQPRVLDRLFVVACERVLARTMGASMACTRVDLCRAADVVRHTEDGRIVYLWGLIDHLPPHLRGVKLLGACDDFHDLLKASMPA
jgi:glycerophosphoryl diester phosphodiesterase